MSEETLPVVEVFDSIKGEGLFMGTPMRFLRLANCNLNCPFCDTEYTKAKDLPLSKLAEMCSSQKCLVVTGGEPLLHGNTVSNLLGMIDRTCTFTRFHLETNGTIMHDVLWYFNWVAVSPKVIFGAAFHEEVMQSASEIKLPVRDEKDLEAALKFYDRYSKSTEGVIWYLQPWNTAHHNMDEARTQKCISKDALQLCIDACNRFAVFRLGVQLHKYIGVQ